MLKPALNRKISAPVQKKMQKVASIFFSIFSGLLLLFSSTIFALTSDSEQPIEISADKVQIDNAKGESTYTGNVELIQGTLHITGSKLVVKTTDAGELTKADVYGSPATLKQQPENRELIDAKANHIEINYNKDQEVTLNKNALLIQGTNKFFGDKIRYIAATNQVIADSKKDTRVKVVISPKTKSKTQQAENTSSAQSSNTSNNQANTAKDSQ